MLPDLVTVAYGASFLVGWFLMAKFYYLVTGKPGQLGKMTFSDGKTLTIVQGDLLVKLIHKEIFRDACYFRHGVSLEGIKNPLVIDAGGNVGFFSRYVMESFPDAEVHLFEPVPMLIDACRENLTSFGCQVYEDEEYQDTTKKAPAGVNVHVYKLALGEEAGSVSFMFDPRASGGSTMVDKAIDPSGKLIRFIRAIYLDGIEAEMVPEFPTRQICTLLEVPFLKYIVFLMCIPIFILHGLFLAAGGASQRQVQATVAPLAKVLKARKLDGRKIDFLKVDVEGAEWMVLQGMDDAAWASVQQAVVEVHDGADGRVKQVMDLLAAKGFKNIHKEDEDFEVHKVVGLSTVFATRELPRKR